MICPAQVEAGKPPGFTRNATTPGAFVVAVPEFVKSVNQPPQEVVCACTVKESVPPPVFDTTIDRLSVLAPCT